MKNLNSKRGERIERSGAPIMSDNYLFSEYFFLPKLPFAYSFGDS